MYNLEKFNNWIRKKVYNKKQYINRPKQAKQAQMINWSTGM